MSASPPRPVVDQRQIDRLEGAIGQIIQELNGGAPTLDELKHDLAELLAARPTPLGADHECSPMHCGKCDQLVLDNGDVICRDCAEGREASLTAQLVELQTQIQTFEAEFKRITKINVDEDRPHTIPALTVFMFLEKVTALLVDRAAPGGEQA